MDTVLVSFAVFYVYSLLNSYLAMPTWAWQAVLVVLSVGAWWAIGHDEWWGIPAIAGITTLIKGSEALLLVTRDRATFDLLRTQRR